MGAYGIIFPHAIHGGVRSVCSSCCTTACGRCGLDDGARSTGREKSCRSLDQISRPSPDGSRWCRRTPQSWGLRPATALNLVQCLALVVTEHGTPPVRLVCVQHFVGGCHARHELLRRSGNVRGPRPDSRCARHRCLGGQRACCQDFSGWGVVRVDVQPHWRGRTVRTRTTWVRNSAMKSLRKAAVDSSFTWPSSVKTSGEY